MNDLDDEDRLAVLGEVLMDELKIIREYLEHLLPIAPQVNKIEQDIVTITSDIQTIKAITRDHSIQLDDHEARLHALEAT